MFADALLHVKYGFACCLIRIPTHKNEAWLFNLKLQYTTICYELVWLWYWIVSQCGVCMSLDLRCKYMNFQRNMTKLEMWCYQFGFSQSSRCKRMCGYLYGKFDCWLILNSQNTIYCHYQKSYLTWGPQYGSKAGDVTANQKHIIFCGVTKANNCERQTDVMNLWSCCCWCVIH